MVVSRRFQNLIADSPYSGGKWLRRVNLADQLFGNTPTEDGSESALAQDSASQIMTPSCYPKNWNRRAAIAALKMERIRIPSPIFRFQAAKAPNLSMHCFPLVDHKVVMADHTGRMFQCDASTREVVTMAPNLQKAKSWPISMFIPSADVIGSDICISTNSCNNTYRLDTARNSWQVSNVKLPLYGKVEYVPELKLWFGFTKQQPKCLQVLAAADLSSSAMDSQSQPQLIGDWKEFEPPEGWMLTRGPQLVNLGSGRFCIARFFKTMTMDLDEVIDRFVVLTGVEVIPVGQDGDASTGIKLRMIKHKSRFHVSNATIIRAIF
uniref:Uncharacterized protein n=1 Tax=Leersia perrieri TaxID=77586 RepID=A0A0D9VNE6_9ORYZ